MHLYKKEKFNKRTFTCSNVPLIETYSAIRLKNERISGDKMKADYSVLIVCL